MKKENTIIVVLIILLFWFGLVIIRLENYHYASQVGMCSEYSGLDKLIQRDKCLNNTQTRTSKFLHLLHGLKVL